MSTPQAGQMASGVLPSSGGVTSKLFMPRPKQTSIPQEPPPTCDSVVQVVDLGDAEQQDSEESCEKQLETSVPAPCLDFEAADDADLLEACRQFDCAQPESAAARFVAF